MVGRGAWAEHAAGGFKRHDAEPAAAVEADVGQGVGEESHGGAEVAGEEPDVPAVAGGGGELQVAEAVVFPIGLDLAGHDENIRGDVDVAHLPVGLDDLGEGEVAAEAAVPGLGALVGVRCYRHFHLR